MTLDVSYDDGATWQQVTLTKGANGYWTGTFKLPRSRGGFISVRASAAPTAAQRQERDHPGVRPAMTR